MAGPLRRIGRWTDPLASPMARQIGRGDGGWITVRGDGLIDQLTELIAKRVGARGGRGALLGIKVV